ncbi:MAG: DegT/DnrJ/EryC1/StrS aminotransferase [Candidatus Gottesmanbacteria bacterium GW2011_GWA1_34_13]|uniref:DegT/DnrJ/EryC1/StrS aminotransferase n=1 Tax=Candidatus Gottesmanbacteria bacterium GW2011_GWA1_34_13 TaxID=1618434 RepID=A0A0G0B444_9BACT|nr:MAG: DegT/DnrJ/EryC1/StrS aminotransferase [Candidatus Gottesmanbacteria bacterium GW2011_GWA1_34_13]
MKNSKMQIGVGDVPITPLAYKYINQVLKSRRITYGKFIQAFEKEIAKLHAVKYAIFCNSGTSALQVALHALKKKYGWKNNDEVIVPAITFVATVNIVLQNNMRPIFTDVTSHDYMLDPQLLESAITPKTRAIIPVHIGGLPADMTPIMKIAKKYNLKIIEDSCETMFAKYNGQPVGSFGDFSCFSTYAAHTLVTGVGGFVCTSDSNLAIIAKSLLNHGRDGIYIGIDDDLGKKGKALFKVVDKRFSFIDVGYSYRATEFEGALGLAQLKDWKKLISARQANAKYLTHNLNDLSKFLQLPQIRKGSEHIFMFYPIMIKDKRIKRTELVFFLEDNGIETRYLLPLLNQPVYKNMWGNIEDKFPAAKNISRNGFYIGSHPGITQTELRYIVDKFHEFFKKYQ